MTRPWVGIAANAHSGRGRGRHRVDRLITALHDRGFEGRVAWTLDGRRAMVREADDDATCHCLVAAGGDGTVAALLNEAPKRPVTVLPAGTENLFARHFRMRHRTLAVADTIAQGRTLPIDLGQTRGRRFALMAGIGFDAEVVSRHHAARVGHTGAMRPTSRAAYVEPVLRASLGYRFPTLRITCDGPGCAEELVGTTAFLFNLPRYALNLPIAPGALADDGLLDLVVFRDAGPLRALRYLWMVFRGLHLRRDGVYHRRVRGASITSTTAAPVQLDGDPGGVVPEHGDGSPWRVDVLPNAVRVMVPESYAPPVAIA